MKNVAIITNLLKDPNLEKTYKLIDFLHKNNYNTYLAKNYKDEDSNYRYTTPDGNIDYVIALGGDGTFLQAVHDYKIYPDAKFIGINIGTIGFMNNIEYNNFENELLNILNESNSYIENYKLLNANVAGKNFSDECLNDIVIGRDGFAHVIELELFIDNKHFYTFSGDGILISTAVGSTAYNLSLGGPIVHPLSETIIITPIAPHSISIKPIVIPDFYNVDIRIIGGHKKSNREAILTCDGRNNNINLVHNDIISIKAKNSIAALKSNNFNYFNNLIMKIK